MPLGGVNVRLVRVAGGVGAQQVGEVVDVGRRRDFPPPNIDLGLGALAWCSEMIPGAGQGITTFAKMAGWLAHAMEEYGNPTRFRSRADYVGTRPAPPSP